MKHWIALLLILFPLVLNADDQPIAVKAQVDHQLVAPKSLVGLPFVIENQGENSVEVNLELILPEGFEQVSSTAPLVIPAKTTIRKLFHVIVPAKVHADKVYSIRLLVTAGDLPLSYSEVTLEAQKAFRMQTELGKRPRRLLPKERATLNLFILNTGNHTDSYQIRTHASPGLQVNAPKFVGSVAPFERREVSIEVQGEEGKPIISTEQLTVEVTSIGAEEKTRTSYAKHFILFDLLPDSKRGHLYRELPSQAKVELFDVGQSGAKTRLNFRTEGGISEHTDLFLNFDYWPIEGDRSDDFSTKDTFRCDVTHRDLWDVSVGKTDATFTSLTKDLYGQGVRLRAGHLDWSVQYFHAKQESTSDVDNNRYPLGARLQKSFDQHGHIGATFQRQTDENPPPDGDPSGEVFTEWNMAAVDALVSFSPTSKLSAEVAKAWLEGADTIERIGWLAKLSLFPKGTRFDLESYRGGTSFPGKINDRLGHRLYVNQKISPLVYILAEAEHYHTNVDRLETRSRTKRTTANGSVYLTTKRWWPSLDLSARTIRDQETTTTHTHRTSLTASKWFKGTTIWARGVYERKDDTIDIIHKKQLDATLSHRYKTVSATLGTAQKWITSVPDALNRFERVYINANWRIMKNMSVFGLYSRSQIGMTTEPSLRGKRWEVGSSFSRGKLYSEARYRFKKGTDAEDDIGDDTAHRIVARCDYSFNKRHRITGYLDAELKGSRNRNIQSIIAWTYNFGLPIPFLKEKSRVAGRLTVDEDVDARLAKARLTLGEHTTYSDHDGHFLFPPVDPGTYPLDVTLAENNASYTSSMQLPVDIQLVKGQEKELVIPFNFACSAGGTVTVDGEPAYLRQIQLLQGSRVVGTTYTNREGVYVFLNLEPGDYIILPEVDRSLDPVDSLRVNLSPREQTNGLNFKLRKTPKKMNLKRFPKQQKEK